MLQIKVTESKEAPPAGHGSYRHYIEGNVYGPDTDPPATLALVRRALAEGWAIPWPPEAQVDPVDLAPLIESLPPIDPDLLIAALGPLPDGVHVLTGRPIDQVAAEVFDALETAMVAGLETARLGLYDSPEMRAERVNLEIEDEPYQPVEPIVAFDASDAIHEPPQEAPEPQGPDAQTALAEAPKPPTAARGNSPKRGGR